MVFSPSRLENPFFMQLKDYYKTLKVQPTATALQIKKSFRQLALLYHPDKNPGNAAAEAVFREIQEAYETLADPGKREEYNYKRWYSRSIKDSFVTELVTPAAILHECLRLNDYLQTVNILRVDFDGLSYHVRQLLNDGNRAIVQQANDPQMVADIIGALLPPAAVLPFKYLAPVTDLLLRLADNYPGLQKQVLIFFNRQKEKSRWQKYRAALVVAGTLLLCWIIYMISK